MYIGARDERNMGPLTNGPIIYCLLFLYFIVSVAVNPTGPGKGVYPVRRIGPKDKRYTRL